MLKILLTGGSSGIGLELSKALSVHSVDCPTRTQLDLNNSDSVLNFVKEDYDVLINCAGTGVGGKIDFLNHSAINVQEILQTNFVNVVLLTQAVLKRNPRCKVINITSTNNNRYWPNDLAYSLSKKALEHFGHMLALEYPDVAYLEVRVGLTKTNFNRSRYKSDPTRFQDIYTSNKYLLPEQVAAQIVDVMFNNNIKFIEISP